MAKINKYAQEAANSKKNSKVKFPKRKGNSLSTKKTLEYQHQPIPKSVEEWCGHRGLIEYQMSKGMAEDILGNRFGKEKNINHQKYLCDFVNDQMGLIGYCIKVVIAG